MSIRRAASCTQPLQERCEPRGARMVRATWYLVMVDMAASFLLPLIDSHHHPAKVAILALPCRELDRPFLGTVGVELSTHAEDELVPLQRVNGVVRLAVLRSWAVRVNEVDGGWLLP